MKQNQNEIDTDAAAAGAAASAAASHATTAKAVVKPGAAAEAAAPAAAASVLFSFQCCSIFVSSLVYFSFNLLHYFSHARHLQPPTDKTPRRSGMDKSHA